MIMKNKIIMKKIKPLILSISILFTATNLFSQANPSVGILPLNPGGVVAVGAVMDVKLTIQNTLAGSIAASKLRPNVTIPANCVILSDAEQTGIPPGWVIVSNNPSTGQIRVCNGSDVIGGNEQRDILIKVQGVTLGGPSACIVNLNFGGATCAVSGPQPSGNITIDDFASSSITVSGTVPVTLLSLTANLINCQPSLNWQTTNEINTDYFVIERSSTPNAQWANIESINATGNSSSETKYGFTDKQTINENRVFYRLKIVDKDGQYKYSDVLPVLVNCKTVQVQAYPNPVQDGKLYVSLTGTSSNADATLLSVSGQVILKTRLSNGTSFINVSAVANGSYVLRVKDVNGVDKKVKVIIQH
jgi:hypothetical protein